MTVLLILSAAIAYGASFNARNLRKQIDRKEYSQAREELENEIGSLRGRSQIEAKLLLARLQTDVDEAGVLYNDVIRGGTAREAFAARVELGKIYYSTGRYRETIDLLGNIPERARSSERFEAKYFRGLAFKELGDQESAIIEFESVDRGDYLYWSYIALAEIDIHYGRIEQAVDRYEMIASSHSNPIAGFKLGECYEILGEREKALNVYRNLARLFPESLEAPQAREKIQMIGGSDRFRRKERVREGGEREETSAEGEERIDIVQQYYTLQFGAFSVRDNAESFKDELDPYIDGLRIESNEQGGTVWYRLRVGRYSSREKAEADALRFMEQTGYSSKVLPVE